MAVKESTRHKYSWAELLMNTQVLESAELDQKLYNNF